MWTDAGVRRATAEGLHKEVAAMNLDNFIVRPQRRTVEKFAKAEAWESLSAESRSELAHGVAGLPTELPPEDEEAKRFDLLLLNLQLTVLRHEPGFDRLKAKVQEIAGLLEEKSSIPMVNAQMRVIEEVQSDEWWQDVTVPMLEHVRRRLRDLVKLIEKRQRQIIYTDFTDMLGAETLFALPGMDDRVTATKFRAKAQAFLKQHQDHVTINKLRMNKALTVSDLAELQRILIESGVGNAGDVDRASMEANGLGLFIRSLVGLDRGAAKDALAGSPPGKL